MLHQQNLIVMAAGVLLVLSVPSAWAGAEKAQVNRWEPTIQAFEVKDSADPPRKGGILFVGSSSIRMWKLGK